MITIICGEDVIASRDYLLKLEEKYRNEGVDLQKITYSQLEESLINISDSPNLFGQKQVLIAENINKYLSRRTASSLMSLLGLVASDPIVELIIWEPVSKRDIKLREAKIIKEFKLSENIFKLLDSCYPSNLKEFLSNLDQLKKNENEMFIFLMLARHIRTLLQIKVDPESIRSLPPWQASKLLNQAKRWSQDKLELFYDSFYKIDLSLKSGKNPHGVKNSLDISACYFL